MKNGTLMLKTPCPSACAAFYKSIFHTETVTSADEKFILLKTEDITFQFIGHHINLAISHDNELSTKTIEIEVIPQNIRAQTRTITGIRRLNIFHIIRKYANHNHAILKDPYGNTLTIHLPHDENKPY